MNDGDTSKFLQWLPSSNPILLLFAFDSIKEFQSVDLDVKCTSISSVSCTVKVKIGIFESILTSTSWTNQFRSITINNNQQQEDTILTHLILSVGKTKGQFVIIQITAYDGLALSEVTFDNRNEFDDPEQNILPSSIYIENNLRRLESLAMKYPIESTSSK